MRILLTGAFGNIGSVCLKVFVDNGHDVTAFDVSGPMTLKRHSKLSKQLDYTVNWGSITKKEVSSLLPRLINRIDQDIIAALELSNAEAVVHLAAIIPPGAYVRPGLAKAVNVDGTKLLIEEMNKRESIPKLVFSSSYTCTGSSNSSKEVNPVTGKTPRNAGDIYGYHKQVCEEEIENRFNGDWVILRFCRILAISVELNKKLFAFLFSMPQDQRVHGCHPYDIGTCFYRLTSENMRS